MPSVLFQKFQERELVLGALETLSEHLVDGGVELDDVAS
jgi:hypothetical protein